MSPGSAVTARSADPWRTAAFVVALVVSLTVSYAVSLTAQTAPSAPPRPPIPHARPFPRIDYRACPIECCRMSAWITTGDVTVFGRARDSTSRLVHLPAAAMIYPDSSTLHTIAPGIVLLQQPTNVRPYLDPPSGAPLWLSQTDTVFITDDIPEAGPTLWIRDAAYPSAGNFWADAIDRPILLRDHRVPVPGLLVQSLHQEWWVRVRYGAAYGWIEAFTAPITGQDGCDGNPTPL